MDRYKEFVKGLIEKSKVKIRFNGKDENLKATAQLIIAEYIEINGFRISLSKFEGVYVQPPSYNTGNRWQNSFWLTEKELWKELENKILEEYESKTDSHFI